MISECKIDLEDAMLFIVLCCVVSDVAKIQEGIGDKFANFCQYFTTFVAGLVIGLAYGWKLALVIFACSPLLVLSGGIMTYVSQFRDEFRHDKLCMNKALPAFKKVIYMC
jgi:uncharacterized membrane protein